MYIKTMTPSTKLCQDLFQTADFRVVNFNVFVGTFTKIIHEVLTYNFERKWDTFKLYVIPKRRNTLYICLPYRLPNIPQLKNISVQMNAFLDRSYEICW